MDAISFATNSWPHWDSFLPGLWHTEIIVFSQIKGTAFTEMIKIFLALSPVNLVVDWTIHSAEVVEHSDLSPQSEYSRFWDQSVHFSFSAADWSGGNWSSSPKYVPHSWISRDILTAVLKGEITEIIVTATLPRIGGVARNWDRSQNKAFSPPEINLDQITPTIVTLWLAFPSCPLPRTSGLNAVYISIGENAVLLFFI